MNPLKGFQYVDISPQSISSNSSDRGLGVRLVIPFTDLLSKVVIPISDVPTSQQRPTTDRRVNLRQVGPRNQGRVYPEDPYDHEGVS